jgi:hypothetical protein
LPARAYVSIFKTFERSRPIPRAMVMMTAEIGLGLFFPRRRACFRRRYSEEVQPLQPIFQSESVGENLSMFCPPTREVTMKRLACSPGANRSIRRRRGAHRRRNPRYPRRSRPVEPSARDYRREVGLVLMVRFDHLDWAAERSTSGVLDRHARREHRDRVTKVAIEAALVVEHADADRLLVCPAARKAERWPPPRLQAECARDRSRQHLEYDALYGRRSANAVRWDNLENIF